MNEDLMKNMLKISDRNFFIVYSVDPIQNTFFEAIRIDEDVLIDNEWGVLSEGMEIFEQIKKHLGEGLYFSVYKNSIGVDWFTTKIPENSNNKM